MKVPLRTRRRIRWKIQVQTGSEVADSWLLDARKYWKEVVGGLTLNRAFTNLKKGKNPKKR
jgi:hypothetical protein